MTLSLSTPHSAVRVLLLSVLAMASYLTPVALAQPPLNPDEPWNWSEEYVLSQVNQVRAAVT